MHSLEEIETEVNRLAAIISASGHVLPTYGRSEDFARPHIEADERGYHFVVVERGQELERFTTRQLDDLLFHIFQCVTFSLAMNYEVKHRIRGQDCRRLLFSHQIKLLSKLSSAWARQESFNHEKILRENPLID